MRNAKKTLGFSMAAKRIDGYDTPEGGCIRREISINKQSFQEEYDDVQ